MSTTKELAQSFKIENPPIKIQTMLVRQFELIDPNDISSSLREISSINISTSYCWQINIKGIIYWISQENNEKMIFALNPVEENQNRGNVVGMLTKVRLDGKTRVYGPVELYEKQWRRLQSSGIIIQ